MKMKLYYAETLNPRKACTVAKYLNSPVEYVRVELAKGAHKKPEYLAMNPNGKVPTLVVSEDFVIWEADAIMAYLARFAGSDLLPEGDKQIEVMRWLSWGTQHFTRHGGGLYFEFCIKPWIGLGEADPAAVKSSQEQFRLFAKILDEHLANKKFLLGDQLTIADFSVGVTLPYAKKAQIPLPEFPNVARWHDRLNELPAWRDPYPVPDALAA
jgi:glutathione S-transferase